MESRWAPNWIEKFLGMTLVLVLVFPPTGGEGEGYEPLGACIRLPLWED